MTLRQTKRLFQMSFVLCFIDLGHKLHVYNYCLSYLSNSVLFGDCLIAKVIFFYEEEFGEGMGGW